MAYNEKMNERVRLSLAGVKKVEEKNMFRGTTFMVNGKMAISTGDDRFMFRIDPALHDEMVEQEGVTGVIMRGRRYKGYVHVQEDVVPTKGELDKWVKLVLDFNKRAKASKKKK
ncbi:MAG: TfoX/Sxy family protein [Candidatus Kapaibacterium sp.]